MVLMMSCVISNNTFNFMVRPTNNKSEPVIENVYNYIHMLETPCSIGTDFTYTGNREPLSCTTGRLLSSGL
jgi:hypothetical protein